MVWSDDLIRSPQGAVTKEQGGCTAFTSYESLTLRIWSQSDSWQSSELLEQWNILLLICVPMCLGAAGKKTTAGFQQFLKGKKSMGRRSLWLQVRVLSAGQSMGISYMLHLGAAQCTGSRAFPAALCHPSSSAGLQGLTQSCHFQLCLWIAFLEGVHRLLMPAISIQSFDLVANRLYGGPLPPSSSKPDTKM